MAALRPREGGGLRGVTERQLRRLEAPAFAGERF